MQVRWVRLAMTAGFTAGALCACACAFSWNGFTLLEWWRESRSGIVVWRGEGRARVAALTFDDGPDPRFTPRVLATLHRYGVRGTFFETGSMVRRYPSLARAVAAQGNVIGNHTDTHPHLERESARQVSRELAICDHDIEAVDHLHPRLFRPPRGNWNPTIFRAARQNGDRLVLWTVAVEHHDAPTPAAMASRALRLARPGAIFLLHDGGGNREATVQALPRLIAGLQRRGYRLVTVPELLKR